MATISNNTSDKVVTMDKWLGLYESEDGDVEIPLGGATICKNWKITRDGNLKRRSGYEVIVSLSDTEPVQGMWCGEINGVVEMLASCNGSLYRIYDADTGTYITERLGALDTSSQTTFFAFGGVIYIMDGKEFYKYDGDKMSLVHGYRPLLYTALTPAGAQPEGGSSLETVNKLTGTRRVWYSPDGETLIYQLPETNIISVDYVMLTSGTYVDPSEYTFDTTAGTVTFADAPTAGVNTIEIGYTMINTARGEVTSKRFAEMFSGSTDLTVVIYGDGTNQALYSGVDYNGEATAEYFPDLNVINVGDQNTPITSMIRHSSALIAFKTDSTWSIAYGTLTTAEGSTIQGFYVTPINRTLGSIPMGQAVQILNFPYTLSGVDLYSWKPSSRYATTLSFDERTAKRESDRIYSTLKAFDIPNVRVYDDNYHQEMYICNPSGKEALVWNYVANAWYYYDDFPMNCAFVYDGDLIFGSTDGKVERMNENIYSDNGGAFESVWEGGSMDFGANYRRKFSNEMWLVVKPISRGHVGVTIRTDRKGEFDVKDTDSYLMDFWDIDFTDFSFDINRTPRTYRHRLKAKKFVFYKLRLESDDAETSATVLSASFKVRLTGYAK